MRLVKKVMLILALLLLAFNLPTFADADDSSYWYQTKTSEDTYELLDADLNNVKYKNGENVVGNYDEVMSKADEIMSNKVSTFDVFETFDQASYLTNNGYTVTVPFIRNTRTGRIASCLNFDMDPPQYTEYEGKPNPFNDDLMAGSMYYGYGGIDNSLQSKYGINDSEAIYARGIVTWRHAKRLGIPGNDGQTGFNGLAGDSNLVAYIEELTTKRISLVPQDFNIDFDGRISKQNPQSTTPISITVQLPYSVIVNAPAYSTDLNGVKKTTFGAGESFRIQAPANYTGSVGVEVQTIQKLYGALMFRATDSSKQNVVEFGNEDPIPHNKSLSLDFTGSLLNIELVKDVIGYNDDTNSLEQQPNLEGFVELELWKKIAELPRTHVDVDTKHEILADGSIVEYVGAETTDHNNAVRFSDLLAFDDGGDPIDYYFREVKAPDYLDMKEGFNLLPKASSKVGETYTATVDNKVKPIEIGTQATTADGGKEVEANTVVKLQDVIEVKNDQCGFVPGHTYTYKTIVMDKETGEPLVTKNGTVESTVVFIAEDECHTQTITLELDTTGLENKDIVFFEYLYYGEIDPSDEESVVIAEHEDIDDGNQTIHIKELPKPVTPPVLPQTGQGWSMMLKIGGFMAVIGLVALVIVAPIKKYRESK